MVIVLKDADFRNANIGQIDIPTANLLSLRIEGADSVEGLSSSYVCKAVYDDNSERVVTSLVTWSIVDDTYATISNGVLNIKSSANNNTVQITVSWNSKYASKSVTVTFLDTISSDAQAIIEAYGNKTLSTDQRHAFDDFYADFASKSWKDNVKILMIPILCPPTNEALSTLTDLNATNAGYNIISNASLTFNTVAGKGYGLSGGNQYGIAKIGNNGIQKDTDVVGNSNFLTLIYTSTAASGVTNTNLSVVYAMKRSNSVAMQTGPSVNYSIYYRDGQLKSVINNQSAYTSNELDGLVIGQNVKSSSDYYVYINGVQDTNIRAGSFNDHQIDSLGILAGAGQSDGSVGLIALGAAFDTHADFKEFADMCKTLMDSLWGNTQTSNNESSGNEINQ